MKIILFGAGRRAEKFYYRFRHTVEIVHCLSNTLEGGGGGQFHGFPIKAVTQDSIKGCYIVVASTYYPEISRQLKNYGLREFTDFCESDFWRKKIAIVYGNCHMSVLKEYLNTSSDFRRQYYIYPLPAIQDISEGEIDDNLLRHCSLFIHQDIRRENPFGYKLCDEYIISRLPKETKQIIVPNLFGLGFGFFPQSTNKIIDLQKHGLKQNDRNRFFYADSNIDFEMENGNHKDTDSLITWLKSDCPYEKDFIVKEFNRSMDKIREREEKWDVKILDFILANYRFTKLFYEPWHPTNFVMKQIAGEVLKILNIAKSQIRETQYCADSKEMPLYPCVIKALGLQFEDRNLCRSGHKLTEGEMDFDEWVREYLYWHYNL